jgi:signal transduction histidine kinase
MIDDLLDMSAIEADKIQLSKEDIALDVLVREVEQILRVRADHVGINFEVVVPDTCAIHADPRRLKQILLNLGSNAVKFTETGGSVTLSAECGGNGGCRIVVADTGIGISPHDLDSILEPFGQLDNFVNRRGGGTGLGLPLTKRLVELHGGKLMIDSELGKGTTVTVTFPDVGAPVKVANRN